MAAEFGIGIFRGDDFTLFGNPYLPLHRALRLGKNRLIAGAAAAADGTTAAMEQPQAHTMTGENFGQRDLAAVQRPAGGEKATVLVAVGIAEHDFLQIATTGQKLLIKRQGKQLRHHRWRIFKIAYGLEQRHDIHIQYTLARA